MEKATLIGEIAQLKYRLSEIDSELQKEISDALAVEEHLINSRHSFEKLDEDCTTWIDENRPEE